MTRKQSTSAKPFVCPCSGLCGVGKTDQQISEAFFAKHGRDAHMQDVDRRVRWMGRTYWR